MSDETAHAAKVEIFGVVYSLKGAEDPERLVRAGAVVDEKMREAAAQGAGADRGGLAILAALNLADELIRSRDQVERDRGESAERIARLSGRLAGAL